MLTRRTLLFFMGSLLIWGAAQAVDFQGFTLPNSVMAGGKHLRLNGVGLRSKAVLKIYVGALYVESVSRDPAKILAADSGKMVRMLLLRDMSRQELVDEFQGGFERNARNKDSQSEAFNGMLMLVPDMRKGESLTFTYLPARGTTLQVADKELGVFPGREFANAVFSIWLGPKPPSEYLQIGMLGR
jgi:hypothetical protein